MKQIIFIAGTFFLFGISVVNVVAEETEKKINDQNQKIESIKDETRTLETLKIETELVIKKTNSEIQKITEEKTAVEKQANEISLEIKNLNEKINKRKEVLKNQARDIQVSNSSNGVLETLVNSESISDAINRAIASLTIMNASNSIVEQQKMDIEKSEKLEEKFESKLSEIENKALELKKKQEDLSEIKLGQELELAELSLSLNTEESKKKQLIQERDAAEKKRKEALELLNQQKKEEERAKSALEANTEKSTKEEQLKSVGEESTTIDSSEELSNNNQSTQKLIEPEEIELEKQELEKSVPEKKEPIESGTSEMTNNGWNKPLDVISISSRFGYRTDPTGYSGNQHDGLDFTGSTGTPIYSINSGKVISAGYGPSTGNYVIVQHSNGMYSYYMHMSTPPSVSEGQTIPARSYLGGMGTTGNSTGVHLHLGMSTALWSGFVDPATYLGL
ncbi:peptidoglycan DD-metalloendopeptidase family protein [Enterococcus casseliflavus]|uniref:peptidoglycan DD-metalloendopeptidase family protein n=1 Tax=Enterococcus casseliflavus TaxID=37734 RepID=UPI0039A74D7C